MAFWVLHIQYFSYQDNLASPSKLFKVKVWNHTGCWSRVMLIDRITGTIQIIQIVW